VGTRLTGVELRRLRLPLVRPFVTAHGTEAERDVILVRVTTDAAEGWGECAAGSAPGYTAEYADGAADVLRRFLVPGLLATGDLGAVAGHPMAKAALATAVLDAELRAANESLAGRLGATSRKVRATATIGLSASLDDLLREVDERVAAGYRAVKLKVAPGWDVEPVAAVRARFSPEDLDLLADANGAYARDDAVRLAALDEHRLLVLEQPLPPSDLVGSAELAARLATPLGLDESITCADDVTTVAALGAARVVNVKAARVGGPLDARRVQDACVAAGLVPRGGGMLETGVGRAAALAVAALPPCSLPADLSASDRYWAEDLTDPFTLDGDGCLTVPTGPGIGVVPRPDALDRATIAVEALA
jgi:o-succinylbenzoate synthase